MAVSYNLGALVPEWEKPVATAKKVVGDTFDNSVTSYAAHANRDAVVGAAKAGNYAGALGKATRAGLEMPAAVATDVGRAIYGGLIDPGARFLKSLVTGDTAMTDENGTKVTPPNATVEAVKAAANDPAPEVSTRYTPAEVASVVNNGPAAAAPVADDPRNALMQQLIKQYTGDVNTQLGQGEQHVRNLQVQKFLGQLNAHHVAQQNADTQFLGTLQQPMLHGMDNASRENVANIGANASMYGSTVAHPVAAVALQGNLDAAQKMRELTMVTPEAKVTPDIANGVTWVGGKPVFKEELDTMRAQRKALAKMPKPTAAGG